MKFNTIEEALEDIRHGRMIMFVDDEDRENEGDLLMAAEKVTPESVNFMATYGKGMICSPLTEECTSTGTEIDGGKKYRENEDGIYRNSRPQKLNYRNISL